MINLPEMELFSFSRLNFFETCPRRFAYKYVLHLEDLAGPPAVLGKTVHKAIELCLNGRSLEDAVTTAFLEEGDDTVEKATVETMVKTALAYGYRGLAERHFVLPLTDKINLQGYIDLIPNRSRVPTVIDWKTGFKVYGVLHTWQLPLYAAAVMNETGAERVKGVLAFLRFRNTQFAFIGHEEALRAKAWAIRTAEEIQQRLELLSVLDLHEVFPARPTPACGNCLWSLMCLREEQAC